MARPNMHGLGKITFIALTIALCCTGAQCRNRPTGDLSEQLSGPNNAQIIQSRSTLETFRALVAKTWISDTTGGKFPRALGQILTFTPLSPQEAVIKTCTGYLVAPDMVLTASHCIPERFKSHSFCNEQIAFVLVDSGKGQQTAYCDQIVYKSGVEASQSPTTPPSSLEGDVAIIRLKRPLSAQGRAKFGIGGVQSLEKVTAFVIDESPTGGTIRKVDGTVRYGSAFSDWRADRLMTSIFASSDHNVIPSNSGAPVFNQDGLLISVLQSKPNHRDIENLVTATAGHRIPQGPISDKGMVVSNLACANLKSLGLNADRQCANALRNHLSIKETLWTQSQESLQKELLTHPTAKAALKDLEKQVQSRFPFVRVNYRVIITNSGLEGLDFTGIAEPADSEIRCIDREILAKDPNFRNFSTWTSTPLVIEVPIYGVVAARRYDQYAVLKTHFQVTPQLLGVSRVKVTWSPSRHVFRGVAQTEIANRDSQSVIFKSLLTPMSDPSTMSLSVKGPTITDTTDIQVPLCE